LARGGRDGRIRRGSNFSYDATSKGASPCGTELCKKDKKGILVAPGRRDQGGKGGGVRRLRKRVDASEGGDGLETSGTWGVDDEEHGTSELDPAKRTGGHDGQEKKVALGKSVHWPHRRAHGGVEATNPKGGTSELEAK